MNGTTRHLVKKVFPRQVWKEAGVRGIVSPFIKIYERGQDTPHPASVLYYRVMTYLPDYWLEHALH